MSSPDRTVHATGVITDETTHTVADYEVVRYDRSGKWWVEMKDRSSRRQVSLDVAVQWATYPVLGLPGGTQFDARIKRDHPERLT